jgi:hypothetical protein
MIQLLLAPEKHMGKKLTPNYFAFPSIFTIFSFHITFFGVSGSFK